MDVHCEMASTGSKRRRLRRRTDVEPCILGVRARLCAFPPRVAHGRPPSALPVSGSAAAIAESEEGFDRSSRTSSQTGTPPRAVLAIHLFRVQLLFENVHVVDRCCVFFSSPPGTRLFDIPPGPCWDDGVKQVQFNVVCFFLCCETASLCQNLSWVEVAGIRPGPGLR